MIELSKANEAKQFFDDIVKENQGEKITSVFSFDLSYHNYDEYRIYDTDEPIYIVFENGQCLIIEYRFIDALHAELRPLNEEERSALENQIIEDYFNCTVDIHGWDEDENGYLVVGGVDRTETISLEYDTLASVELRRVTKEYEKWIDGNIDYVTPTEDTFDQIKFIMSNGNTFVICADDAEVDGYTLSWSTDAKETMVRYN